VTLLADGCPPIFPPEWVLGTGGMGDEPTEDECPRCRSVKAGVCGCGYDWTRWEWVDERRAA
jgi:hypothetical protein